MPGTYNDISDTIFDGDLPYCLVTCHTSYKAVTRQYLQPQLLKSSKLALNANHSPGLPKQKVSLKKRNRQIRQIGLSVEWTTFITLTFAPDNYPPDNNWKDYVQIQQKFRAFTRALKYRYPDLKYLGVLEHGKKHGRKHFHLLTNIPYDSTIFEFNLTDKRKICNLWQEGYTDVQKVNNDNCNAVFYLLKYVEKGDNCRTPIGKREVFASKGLGKVKKKVVHRSKLHDELDGYKFYDKYYHTEIWVKKK